MFIKIMILKLIRVKDGIILNNLFLTLTWVTKAQNIRIDIPADPISISSSLPLMSIPLNDNFSIPTKSRNQLGSPYSLNSLIR
jgi:hypothetical protein|tara:strand:- start:217 stop:465 length:249 start_codon:yes stop_codon:yes gene_type:complete